MSGKSTLNLGSGETIVLEGPDQVGKSMQLRRIHLQLQAAGWTPHSAPSLNQYLEDAAGLDHSELRTWRFEEASPSAFASAVLDAHARRISDMMAYRQSRPQLLDRGLLTLEAGCIALCRLKKAECSDVVDAFRASDNGEREHVRITIALMFSRSASSSVRTLMSREGTYDERYLRYQRYLYEELLHMASTDRFRYIIWTEGLQPTDVTDRLLRIILRELRWSDVNR